jgi:hypothetical protein
VNIAEFLGELASVSNVGVIVPPLPEVFGIADQAARDSLLQRFDRYCERFPLRLGKQEMGMLGHDHTAVDPEPETAPDALQCCFKGRLAGFRQEQRSAAVTAERDELGLPRVLKALQL